MLFRSGSRRVLSDSHAVRALSALAGLWLVANVAQIAHLPWISPSQHSVHSWADKDAEFETDYLGGPRSTKRSARTAITSSDQNRRCGTIARHSRLNSVEVHNGKGWHQQVQYGARHQPPSLVCFVVSSLPVSSPIASRRSNRALYVLGSTRGVRDKIQRYSRFGSLTATSW